MDPLPSILFITTSSLATNPRLVKEFEFLKATHKCYVLSFEHKDWSLKPSQEIIGRNRDIEFITINRHKQLMQTLLSKLYHKSALVLNAIFKSNLKISAFASNDKTPQLCLALTDTFRSKNINRIIAHNLGAFFPASILATRLGVKLQLDIEDYHPDEAFYFNEQHELHNRLLVMQKSFDQAEAITYASEGIMRKCETEFEINSNTKSAVIINAFKASDFVKPSQRNSTINYVWFSQNINSNRGLEAVFSIANDQPNCKFHLIGKANHDFIEAMQPSENIIIHKPMAQDALHEFLSTMDIGLALENKDSDGNRDICLTNKFLAYAQAGLYIVATNTFGQKHFLDRLGGEFGTLIKTSLDDTLSHIDQRVLDYNHKIERWEKAKRFSWENEKIKLINLIL